jgi:hypothetical protein
MEKNMYYTIYKITNKVNGKIYIGSHKTKNLGDGYMGSGKYLMRSMEKHGLDNFEKEILFVFESAELMYAKEAELVNEEFLAEANTYNLKVGGFGGWDYINTNGSSVRNITSKNASAMSKLGQEKIREKRLDPEYNKTYLANKFIPKSTHAERVFASECARKVNLGSMMINNGSIVKKIKRDAIIPDGWIKGSLYTPWNKKSK